MLAWASVAIEFAFGCHHTRRSWPFGKWNGPQYQQCLECGAKLPCAIFNGKEKPCPSVAEMFRSALSTTGNSSAHHALRVSVAERAAGQGRVEQKAILG